MSGTLDRPDFSQFDVVSINRRRRFSAAFLALCVITASLSIVILGVLLTSIIIGALPVFGPHADRLETQNRMVIVQGTNAGNDPEVIDAGDMIQGLILGENMVRGGLGKDNDEKLVDPDSGLNPRDEVNLEFMDPLYFDRDGARIRH